MTTPLEIRTSHHLLRRWRPTDGEPFAELNADPGVTKHLPGPLSKKESDSMITRIEAHFADHGFGVWAVEIPGVARFAGFIGLSVPSFEAHFTPCVEVGWRLAREYWGHGYATEGARVAVDWGFEQLGLNEIVSFTVPDNKRSRRVMEKIGMTHDPTDDFDHPWLPVGHPLRRHLLYRICRRAMP